MRVALSRGLVLGAVLAGGTAAVTAQPPQPGTLVPPPPSALSNKLKTDTAALAEERAAAESTTLERDRLRKDLLKLLDRIDKMPAPGPMGFPPVPTPVTKGKDDPPLTGTTPVDELRKAMNLVRDNQIEPALFAFQNIPTQTLAPEDRAFVRFMTASCLRRLGRPAQAMAIYREVGDANEEPFIASSAVSQVALLRTSEELQAQLTQLRARPKSR